MSRTLSFKIDTATRDLAIREDGYVELVTGGAEVRQAVAAAEPKGPAWRPPRDAWEAFKKATVRKEGLLVVMACRRNGGGLEILAAGETRLGTSADPVGAPILYLDVSLPFAYAIKNPDTIRWRLLDPASNQAPPVVLENLPVCGNCHSASLNGKILGMDVDYASDKGSYALVPISPTIRLDPPHIITWADFRREDGDDTYGLLAQVSPTGRYSVCTVKDRSVFVPREDLAYSQLFFPVKGILCVYDRAGKRFRLAARWMLLPVY